MNRLDNGAAAFLLRQEPKTTQTSYSQDSLEHSLFPTSTPETQSSMDLIRLEQGPSSRGAVIKDKLKKRAIIKTRV